MMTESDGHRKQTSPTAARLVKMTVDIENKNKAGCGGAHL